VVVTGPGGERRYFFVHIQKTAGTALFRRLRHAFGTDAVYPLPDEQGTPDVVLGVDRLQRRLAELGPQIRVVTGHFPLCTVDVLAEPFATFTVLRDPVDRVLSFLRHQREVEPRFADWPLDAIYRDPIATGPLVANHMVRMLSLRAPEMDAGALTAIDLDQGRLDDACRNLVERIDVVGLQEHFEAFCTDLEQAFGWDLGAPLFMNRTAPAETPPGLAERIAEDNRLDAALYRFAAERWAETHDRPS
jgi:hypothetical protein